MEIPPWRALEVTLFKSWMDKSTVCLVKEEIVAGAMSLVKFFWNETKKYSLPFLRSVGLSK